MLFLNKHQFITLLAFLFLACIVLGLVYFIQTLGWLSTAISFIALSTFCFVVFILSKKIRFSFLYKKYNDKELVRKIMNRTLWQGQTAEQVIDALGKPKDIDQIVLKTKTKEVWKYFPSGHRQYGLRITLDNDEVVGWDDKL